MANLNWSTVFSAKGAGNITVSAKTEGLGDFQKVVQSMDSVVRSSRDGLLTILHTAAPEKSGALRRGIVASTSAEKTATPGKVVYDIYMDDAMNDIFVKYAASGKRYYYPASQEYGFRLKNGGYKPGKYYMRDTTIRYAAAFEKDMTAGMDKALEAL